MSFNKRYYSIESITDIYLSNGITGVINNFNKTDALFFKDNISSEIYTLISKNLDKDAVELIKKNLIV
jgi:hypothetical protein